MAETLTAGRLAKAGGVNVQTVRYYERRRLLLPARRTDSGYRLNPPEAVRVLRFIKNAQDLGFTLEEIARLLRLRVRHKGQCGAVRRQPGAPQVVRGKLADLRASAGARTPGRTCTARGRRAMPDSGQPRRRRKR